MSEEAKLLEEHTRLLKSLDTALADVVQLADDVFFP